MEADGQGEEDNVQRRRLEEAVATAVRRPIPSLCFRPSRRSLRSVALAVGTLGTALPRLCQGLWVHRASTNVLVLH